MKPIPVRLKVVELDVVAIITKVSNGFSIVVNVLHFLLFFSDLLFLSLMYVIISLMLLIWLLKLFTSFNFFSNLRSKSIFSKMLMGLIYLFSLPFIYHKLLLCV